MLGGRVAWLGRPWFFAVVVVLALNDHVLKGAWPGWVTGKLSDVAGVVVVATLCAVVAGPTWGLALAGLGFTALKAIPGVAEAASPLLGGGVVLRDLSDLIALGVLPPLWWLLRHERPDQQARNRRGWQALGLVATVLVTTATSQSPPHYVSLGSAAGMVYAQVDPGDGFDDAYLASADGGRTWASVSRESARSSSIDWDVDRAEPEGNPQVCAADATCYRITYDRKTYTRQVERSVAGSPWQLDSVLERGPGYYDELAIDTAASDHVVALGADRTVYSRYSGGYWVEVDLGPLVAPPQWQRSVVVALGSQSGVIATFGLALILSVVFAPWTGVRWVLGVVNVLAGGFVWVWAILATPVGIVHLSGTWLALLAVLLAMMRFSRWLDGRSRAKNAATPDPRDSE